MCTYKYVCVYIYIYIHTHIPLCVTSGRLSKKAACGVFRRSLKPQQEAPQGPHGLLSKEWCWSSCPSVLSRSPCQKEQNSCSSAIVYPTVAESSSARNVRRSLPSKHVKAQGCSEDPVKTRLNPKGLVTSHGAGDANHGLLNSCRT